MSQYWTYAEILARTKHLVNFNPYVTDQTYIGTENDPDLHFRTAINEAYVDEINDAKQHGALDVWFHRSVDFIWESGEVNFTLPSQVKDRQIISLRDVTNGFDTPIWVMGKQENSNVFWSERNVLQWGTSGPGSDTTLRFVYVAQPSEMKSDNDIPELIPPEHRHILPWSAAIIMRDIGENEAPTSWRRRRDELREKFWKDMCLGRPMESGYTGIHNSQPEWLTTW